MQKSATPTVSSGNDTQSWLDSLTIDELETDPYPIFERLRAEAPLAYIPAVRAWVASTWELCNAIARDADNFRGGTSRSHERTMGAAHILGAVDPLHRDLRSIVDPPLRPRAFKPLLEDMVRPTVRHYLEQIRDQGGAELMSQYFEPISVRCVGNIIGFDEVDDETLRRWFHGLASGIANTAMTADGQFARPQDFAAADAATTEIREYLQPIVARLTESPDDSTLSQWLHAGMPDGQIRNLEYLAPTIHVILLGGLQEPGHMCGSSLLGLFSRPDQLKRVIEDPALIPRSLTEGLRWLAPVFSAATRLPVRDFEYAGVKLYQGDTIWLSYGSANRDESIYPHADQYDIDREAHPHLAFGAGRHVCSGAAYSPHVARIAFEELFAAFPTIAPDPNHDSTPWGWLFRGPRELHVTWAT